jgi:hypothetical protein
VICGRSNEEIELLKKAYSKKYNKDKDLSISILVASELSGVLKKVNLDLACLLAMEEMHTLPYVMTTLNERWRKSCAIFHLNMKLNMNPYKTAAEHIKSICAGIGTDEVGLSCAILRYQHILPHVMVEHITLLGQKDSRGTCRLGDERRLQEAVGSNDQSCRCKVADAA